MPMQSLPRAKAGVGIHVFPWCKQRRRGWRAFAHHDDDVRSVSQSIRYLV
jgi:hypothetical protein